MSEKGEAERTDDLDRLRSQALEISCLLAEAGVGSCTLPEGVRVLIRRGEAFRDALAVALPPDMPLERFLGAIADPDAMLGPPGPPVEPS